MRNQLRCILAVFLTVAGLAAVAYPNDPAADAKAKSVAPTGIVSLELGKPIRVSVHSTPIKTKEREVCLLHLNKAEFHLDGESQLTAKITASTMDGWTMLPPVVKYKVHAAVFDEKDRL